MGGNVSAWVANVFPTGVGMNREGLAMAAKQKGVPYGCGDEPIKIERDTFTVLCSLRVWG